MKRFLKKIIPVAWIDRYHFVLAKLAAQWYGHPSDKLIVIGVTGTNGKSTTAQMIGRVLESAGHVVGVTSTVSFRIAGTERLNDMKMTMPGRFRLQKLLRQMVDVGCTHAVIETSSEGIKQHRHSGINYDIAVFTNLTPEHIESHGGFENYKQAKGELFAQVFRGRRKVIGGRTISKVSVVNGDDDHAEYFLSFPVDKKYEFSLTRSSTHKNTHELVVGENVVCTGNGSTFTVQGVAFSLRMLGAFNVENALAAISVGLACGVPVDTASTGLAALTGVPGRLERIDEGQPFNVIVDYAPEPASFAKLYDVVTMVPHGRIIHVFGSCGGGRDVARRPVLGRIAGLRADVAIVTNEDPYDDDPDTIIDQVAAGARAVGKVDGESLFCIRDRQTAILKAVTMARDGDIVLVTGKGAEQAIVGARGTMTPWDDRDEVRQALHTIGFTKK